MVRLATVLAGLVLAFGVLAATDAAQPGGMTWKVAIGGEAPDHGIQANLFAPKSITINAGDTVTWTMGAVYDHTVTFLSGAKPPDPFVPEQGGKKLRFNPLVAFPQGGSTYAGKGMASSGFLHLKGNYSLTFTKPGRYEYLCLLHPGMTAAVVVQPAGKKLPATQADYDTVAAQQVGAALRQGRALVASAKITTTKGKTGTVYTTSLVGSIGARVAVVRFIPETLTIKAGDSVRWLMKDPTELHAVTFSGPQQPPDFVVQEPQPQGPPKLYFNPKVAFRGGGPTHKGDGYYSSGFLELESPGPDHKSYTLTFTKPGTYTYWCVVHLDQGMKGTVQVL
jgi:plastocyanin